MVHHFCTEERREQAIRVSSKARLTHDNHQPQTKKAKQQQELARIVRPGGRVLVTVWAKEQPRFASEPCQDAMVPWNYQARPPTKSSKCCRNGVQAQQTAAAAEEKVVYQRFYHLFCKGELDRLVERAGGLRIDESGEQAGNYFVAATKEE